MPEIDARRLRQLGQGGTAWQVLGREPYRGLLRVPLSFARSPLGETVVRAIGCVDTGSSAIYWIRSGTIPNGVREVAMSTVVNLESTIAAIGKNGLLWLGIVRAFGTP